MGGDGKKMPPYFFEKKPNGKGIDQEEYIRVLEEVVWPWIKTNYADQDIAYVWQQDGAPAHTGSTTQEWLEENAEDFFPKDMWPPSSPDLGCNSIHLTSSQNNQGIQIGFFMMFI